MRALAAALAVSLLASCGYGRTPAAEPEEKTAQVTVWDDRYEIFLEHKLIVAGTPTKFITHVTDLKSLEPRREGPAVFVMKLGPDLALEHVQRAPDRAGIYEAVLTFPKAGDWEVDLKIDDHTSKLPRFTVYATKADVEKAPEPEAPEGQSFLKEQQWKVLTRTEVASKRRLVERIRLPAVVKSPPAGRAAVVPPIGGRLFAEKAPPTVGQRVSAGQILAYVQPPHSDLAVKLVEAEADVIRAKLAFDQAELTHQRVRRLAAEKAKSERELQEAEFAAKSAKAAYDAAVALRAAYDKSGAVFVENVPALALRAPIAGTITTVTAALGEHVESDRAVFTILDTATVHVEARVPQGDVARVGAAPGALLDGRTLAKPLFVGLEVDAATRTVPILYEIANEDGRLRPGMAVTLHLETARAEDAIAVPLSAIVDEDARPILFVQVSGETFQKRDQLKLGIRDGEWVQVLSGLAEGERVVTKEAFAIRLASVSSVIPAHGHAH